MCVQRAGSIARTKEGKGTSENSVEHREKGRDKRGRVIGFSKVLEPWIGSMEMMRKRYKSETGKPKNKTKKRNKYTMRGL